MRRLHPNAHVEVPDPGHPGSILEVCVSDLTVFDLIEARWKPIGKVDALVNELFEVREDLAKARSRNEELEEQVAALKELVDELSAEAPETPPAPTAQQVHEALDEYMDALIAFGRAHPRDLGEAAFREAGAWAQESRDRFVLLRDAYLSHLTNKSKEHK